MLGTLYGNPKVSRKTPHKYLLGVRARKSPPVPSVAVVSSEASHQAAAFRGLEVPNSKMGVILSPPPSLLPPSQKLSLPLLLLVRDCHRQWRGSTRPGWGGLSKGEGAAWKWGWPNKHPFYVIY